MKNYYVWVCRTNNGFLQQDGTLVQNPGDYAIYESEQEAEAIAEDHGTGEAVQCELKIV